MIAPAARRGEVWFAEVPGDKRRPVLVLTRDPLGAVLHSVICAPISSTMRGLTTEVPLGREAGLAPNSVANFDNTMLLSRHPVAKAHWSGDERDNDRGLPRVVDRDGMRLSYVGLPTP